MKNHTLLEVENPASKWVCQRWTEFSGSDWSGFRLICRKLIKMADVTRRLASVDMLLAFVTLAECLNLSGASVKLRVTRQTVRRHIDALEALRGEKLFKLKDRRYILTPVGKQVLPEAREILQRRASWNGQSRHRTQVVDGFEHASVQRSNGHNFYLQQHSLGTLAQNGLPLLRAMFSAWGQSMTKLYHPAMEQMHPYIVIYRHTGESWICADIGEKSAYARWFGHNVARNAQCILFDQDNVGDEYNAFISKAYLDVHDGVGIRLDHIHAFTQREGFVGEQPLSYQRLLVGCSLPDGRQALAVLVVLTNRISIEALSNQNVPQLSEDLLMEDGL